MTVTMSMGWWKPYFFVDLKSVQLLHEDLVLDGTFGSAFVATMGIFLLAFLDRWLCHQQCFGTQSASSHAVFYTLQKITGGLLMLILMSFNVLLFAEVCLFCGAWEYVAVKRREIQKNLIRTPNGVEVQFSPIQNEDEDGDMDTLYDLK